MRRFDTKEEATKGGVLESAVGKGGGSVRIKKPWHSSRGANVPRKC
ncbi:hypothetical protein AB0V79_25465 [Mesorhizobium ciceri]|nr:MULTISPECIES: hypothetical protein [Mesorhizobium]